LLQQNVTVFFFVYVSSGFVKYRREIGVYRPAEARMNDWEEIYNFHHVRRGLQVQAARCMECGVPFCQSPHGCPLGNIIPKWNDLVYHGAWKEALDTLLQTNNFPGEAMKIKMKINCMKKGKK
jgi:glutamate synthase (NADPH/NADH)